MLFSTPELEAHDHEVVEQIEGYRTKLRHFLAEPRRWRGQLRRNLRARAMRGSNSIEGYDVSLDDAVALLEDEEALDADERTVMEVTGYRNAMTYVQQLADDPDFTLDESLLRGLHFMMLGHDLSKRPGAYRKGPVYVYDEDEEVVVYEGPASDRVPDLMTELVAQLGDQDDEGINCPVLVRASMAHLNLVMIHPFKDGNGRMARCLQTMILARNQILAPEFSSIEEWLGRNTLAYYQVLSAVGAGAWHPERDTLEWVRFNLQAHHMQAQTVLRRLEESRKLWDGLAELASQRGLPDRSVMALYNVALGFRLRRSIYEKDAELESATATRDLRLLVEQGLLVAEGETRGRTYTAGILPRQLNADVRRSRTPLRNPYGASDRPSGGKRKRILTRTVG